MANAFQAFNDSAPGVILGTALHTLGAIGLLGGLVAYMAWHRHLRQGHHHRNVLVGGSALAYLSILANLVGGFMRTYQAGHPHLTDFAVSPWVRAITIKHVFLFAGMAAAVYLFERVAPRHLRAWRDGSLPEVSQTGHAFGVLLVALGIVVAGVLGAVSTVADLGPTVDDGMEDGEDHDGHLARPDAYRNATGQLVGNALAPGEASGTFDVPAGSTDIAATLVWTPTQANLALELIEPDGTGGFAPGGPAGRREGELGSAPVPGDWRYRITSPDPVVNAQWELVLRLPQQGGNQTFLADSVVVPPGARLNFYEINTQAPLGAVLHWDWTASATVYFDVHTHFDDEVQTPVAMDAAAHAGSYTTERAGGHSYLWQNNGAAPVTVTYRVWGDWELDSIVPA